MKENFILMLFLIISSGFFGALLGMRITHDTYDGIKDKCAKEHNVYACRITAAPINTE